MPNGVRYILAYARPGHGESVDDQIARLRPLVTRDEDIYADRLGRKGVVGRSDLDDLLANAREGDLVAVTSMDKLAPNVATAMALLRGLRALGVGLISLDDGIDDRSPAYDAVVALGNAMDRVKRYGRHSWPRPPQQRRGGGRKTALKPSDVKALVDLRDTTSLTWAEIEAEFQKLGRRVKAVTLRKYYAAAKAASNDK